MVAFHSAFCIASTVSLLTTSLCILSPPWNTRDDLFGYVSEKMSIVMANVICHTIQEWSVSHVTENRDIWLKLYHSLWHKLYSEKKSGTKNTLCANFSFRPVTDTVILTLQYLICFKVITMLSLIKNCVFVISVWSAVATNQ